MSGALSVYGKLAKAGLDLAVDELNSEGGILGRRVELLIEDEVDAEHAVRAARRLVQEENVDFLLGVDGSAQAEAIAPLMSELRRILMITHAATPRVTGDLCNRYVFRMSLNVPQNSAAGAQVAATEVKARRWTTIGPDNAFGRQSWEYFKGSLRKLQPDVEFLDDEAQWPKLGNEDFTDQIARLQGTNADAIWSSTFGNDLINLVRQGNRSGLFRMNKPFLYELGAAMEVLEALGDQMPTGLWVGSRWWYQEPRTDANRRFVESYFGKHGHFPAYNAQNAYTGMKLVAAAAETARGVGPDELATVLEGFSMETPMGRLTIRKDDHQASIQAVWGRTAESRDAKFRALGLKFRVLDPVKVFKAEDITPPVGETGCRLG